MLMVGLVFGSEGGKGCSSQTLWSLLAFQRLFSAATALGGTVINQLSHLGFLLFWCRQHHEQNGAG